MEQNDNETGGGGALSFTEALDLAFGARREKVLKIVNISTFGVFCLSFVMLYMTYQDPMVFYLIMGFLAVTVAFAGIFNW